MFDKTLKKTCVCICVDQSILFIHNYFYDYLFIKIEIFICTRWISCIYSFYGYMYVTFRIKEKPNHTSNGKVFNGISLQLTWFSIYVVLYCIWQLANRSLCLILTVLLSYILLKLYIYDLDLYKRLIYFIYFFSFVVSLGNRNWLGTLNTVPDSFARVKVVFLHLSKLHISKNSSMEYNR